jgi:hypothetical protein
LNGIDCATEVTMGAITNELFLQSLTTLLDEAYKGPADATNTWFTTNEPDAGIFGALEALTAAEASRPIVPGGSTIAAHAEHLRWSLAYANAWYRGEHPQNAWAESWLVREVTPGAWESLRQALRAEFDTVRAAISAADVWDNPLFLTASLALIPHAAYHLSAMRQMLLVLRQNPAGIK